MDSIYIDYRPGTLNVILAVPHGGKEKPAEIPDRKPNANNSGSFMYYCNEPDWRTFEASELLRQHLYNLSGKYPYYVASRMDRAKLDPNREVDEATFGNPLTIKNYEYFHGKIEESKAELQKVKGYRGCLIIDLHGQSHPHNLTELGFAIPAAKIDAGSYSLQQDGTLNCAASYLGNEKNQELLTGQLSLGHFLQAESVNCLPSPANSTIQGRHYFTGGYTVRNHHSQWADAVQIELSKVMRSGDTTQLSDNMLRVARGVYNFCKLHYQSP